MSVDTSGDGALVRRLAAGDADAFDEVYARFHVPLYTFLARLLGRRDLAEDLAQETWLRLSTHAHGLRADTRLGPWLYTVARNLSLSFRRWSALETRRLALLHWRAGQGAEALPSPYEQAAAAQTEVRLEAALASLPAKYREVLLLVGVHGLPREDAAAVLGLRTDALRQRLLRARAMIEERLGGTVDDERGEQQRVPARGVPESSR